MIQLLTAALVASFTAPSLPAIDAATAACVSARVLDARAKPVARATVTLLQRSFPATGSIRGGSDASGWVALSDVMPGSYWLIVERVGFEPLIQALELSEQEAWSDDLLLSPIHELVRTAGGRAELPWILRGLGQDPLRFLPGDEAPRIPAAGSHPLATNPVKGQVTWNTLSRNDENGDPLLGKRTSVVLEGLLADAVSWHLNGRLDDYELAEGEEVGQVGSNHYQYGVGYHRNGHGLTFSGEIFARNRNAGPAAQLTSLSEKHSSYRIDYNAGGEDDGLGVSFAYSQAQTDEGQGDADSVHIGDRQALWEGSGSISRRFADTHLVRSQFAIRARQRSITEIGLPSSTLMSQGLLNNGQFLDPGDWQLLLSESYEWQLAAPFAIISGVDFAHVSGGVGGSYLRPRLGARISLAPDRHVQFETSWIRRDSHDRAILEDETGARLLGLQMALEQGLGSLASIRIEAMRNGHMDLDEPGRAPTARDDHLLLARGAMQSRQFRVEIRSAGIGGFVGRASASMGSAEGDLALLLLTPDRPGAKPASWPSLRVRHATASLGGRLQPTGTDLVIRYRWLKGGVAEFSRLEHFDVQLDQELPWASFYGAQLGFQLAVSGYLHGPPDGGGAEGEYYLPSPVVAAGLGVRF